MLINFSVNTVFKNCVKNNPLSFYCKIHRKVNARCTVFSTLFSMWNFWSNCHLWNVLSQSIVKPYSWFIYPNASCSCVPESSNNKERSLEQYRTARNGDRIHNTVFKLLLYFTLLSGYICASLLRKETEQAVRKMPVIPGGLGAEWQAFDNRKSKIRVRMDVVGAKIASCQRRLQKLNK